jgi:hypothetical protein
MTRRVKQTSPSEKQGTPGEISPGGSFFLSTLFFFQVFHVYMQVF